MTESEWLACDDPQPMLEYLGSRPSDRKLRLFACACCRRVWQLLDEGGRQAVETAERFADGAARMRELIATRTAIVARPATTARPSTSPEAQASWAAYWALNNRTAESLWNVHTGAAGAASKAAARAAAVAGQDRMVAWNDVGLADTAAQAELLRHVMGNPFHVTAAPADWPRNVNQLAEALYAGADCAFALHDALLDAGHPELAEHFREREHPKGCWALDAILGRK